MDDITALATSAGTAWTAIAAICVIVVGFVIGRKLVKKIG